MFLTLLCVLRSKGLYEDIDGRDLEAGAGRVVKDDPTHQKASSTISSHKIAIVGIFIHV